VENYEYEMPSDFEDEEIDEDLAFTAEDKKKYADWFGEEPDDEPEAGADGSGDEQQLGSRKRARGEFADLDSSEEEEPEDEDEVGEERCVCNLQSCATYAGLVVLGVAAATTMRQVAAAALCVLHILASAVSTGTHNRSAVRMLQTELGICWPTYWLHESAQLWLQSADGPPCTVCACNTRGANTSSRACVCVSAGGGV
jgi:hypothetical protein